jgi:uncharacterized protein (DUF2164 family)
VDITSEQKVELVTKITDYVSDEFQVELGQFEAEFFVDFIIKELAPVVYNQALYDAEVILKDKIEDILLGLEK